jgi:hypothetical protein
MLVVEVVEDNMQVVKVDLAVVVMVEHNLKVVILLVVRELMDLVLVEVVADLVGNQVVMVVGELLSSVIEHDETCPLQSNK